MNRQMDRVEPATGILAGRGSDHVYVGAPSPQGVEESHFLGEVALVTAFVSWAARHGQVVGLPHLLEPGFRLDPGAILRMHRSLTKMRQLELDPKETGVALSTAMHFRTPMRGLVAVTPTVVLQTSAATVSLVEDGLRLSTSASVSPWSAGSETSDDQWIIDGWSLRGDTARVGTRDGLVSLHSAGVVALLRTLGRGYDDVVVRRLPQRTIFTPLMVFLDDALRQAVHSHGELVIHRGPQSMPHAQPS